MLTRSATRLYDPFLNTSLVLVFPTLIQIIPPRRKIVSICRTGLHKSGREMIRLAETLVLHHKDTLRYFKIHLSIRQLTLVKNVPA